MSETKKSNLLLAFVGAFALMTAAPALAATPATTAPATEAAATTPAEGAAATTPASAEADAEVAPAAEDPGAVGGEQHGELTIVGMFMDADWVVKAVMIGLILASIFSWTLLLIKLFEFGSLNRNSDRFLEAFRGARSLADMRRIATSEEFEGNPMADMAAAPTAEV